MSEAEVGAIADVEVEVSEVEVEEELAAEEEVPVPAPAPEDDEDDEVVMTETDVDADDDVEIPVEAPAEDAEGEAEGEAEDVNAGDEDQEEEVPGADTSVPVEDHAGVEPEAEGEEQQPEAQPEAGADVDVDVEGDVDDNANLAVEAAEEADPNADIEMEDTAPTPTPTEGAEEVKHQEPESLPVVATMPGILPPGGAYQQQAAAQAQIHMHHMQNSQFTALETKLADAMVKITTLEHEVEEQKKTIDDLEAQLKRTAASKGSASGATATTTTTIPAANGKTASALASKQALPALTTPNNKRKQDDANLSSVNGDENESPSAKRARNDKAVGGIWLSHFETLQKFQQEHGHCNITKQYYQTTLPDGTVQIDEDKRKLFNFVSSNRTYHRKMRQGKLDPGTGTNSKGNYTNQLNPQKIQMLDSIGFKWNLGPVLSLPWEERYKQLLTFKQENGHCDVAQHYKKKGFDGIGNWVMQQRRFYRQGKLKPDKVELLEDVGFKWSLRARGGTLHERMKASGAISGSSNVVEGVLGSPTPKPAVEGVAPDVTAIATAAPPLTPAPAPALASATAADANTHVDTAIPEKAEVPVMETVGKAEDIVEKVVDDLVEDAIDAASAAAAAAAAAALGEDNDEEIVASASNQMSV